MTKSEQFFYDNAGFFYDLKTQTKEEVRKRSAALLAKAEEWACEEGVSFHWEVDRYADSSEFSDDPDPWDLWTCVARSLQGVVIGSLGGVDFGRHGEPWENTYRRVVEAELALEAMPEELS